MLPCIEDRFAVAKEIVYIWVTLPSAAKRIKAVPIDHKLWVQLNPINVTFSLSPAPQVLGHSVTKLTIIVDSEPRINDNGNSEGRACCVIRQMNMAKLQRPATFFIWSCVTLAQFKYVILTPSPRRFKFLVYFPISYHRGVQQDH